MTDHNDEPNLQPAGETNRLADAWSARLASMSQDERIAAWWSIEGQTLVAALKQRKDHPPSFLEALAIATGDLAFDRNGYANVTPEFVDALERSCSQSTEYYLLAKHICVVNLSLGKLQPELQLVAALIMSGQLRKPRPGKGRGSKTWHRDLLLVRGVNSTSKFGIAPTRNDQKYPTDKSKPISGCDLVIQAFDKAGRNDCPTYDTAKHAWKNRAELLKDHEDIDFANFCSSIDE